MRHTKRGGWPYSQPPNVPFELNKDSPQAKGLVAWWPMLASAGQTTLHDKLTRVYDATIPASFSWGCDGVAGPYIITPGTLAGLGIRPGDGASLDGFAAMTIAVWCRLDSGAGTTYPGILAKNGCYGLAYKNSDATFYYNVTGTGGGTGWQTHASSYDVDHLYVITYNSADLLLYVDGVYIKTVSTASGPVVDNANGLYIAEREFGASLMSGRLYEIRIYNRVLNASQNWQLHDKETRWELHKPLMRRWVGWKSPVTERIPRYGFTNFQVPGIV